MDVLIAHANDRSREALVRALAPGGFTFVEATDGATALEILMGDECPRLALVEWDLPDIEGPELCRILRDFHLGRPPYVVLLTPELPGRDLAAGLGAGASDFVCTPASAQELRARLEHGRRVAELPSRRPGLDPELAGDGVPAADSDPTGRPAELSAMLTDQWASAFGV